MFLIMLTLVAFSSSFFSSELVQFLWEFHDNTFVCDFTRFHPHSVFQRYIFYVLLPSHACLWTRYGCIGCRNKDKYLKRPNIFSVNKAPFFFYIYMYGTLQRVMWQMYLMYTIWSKWIIKPVVKEQHVWLWAVDVWLLFSWGYRVYFLHRYAVWQAASIIQVAYLSRFNLQTTVLLPSYSHWNNNPHLVKTRRTKCLYTINREHYGFWTDGENGVHVFCTTAEKLWKLQKG